MSSSSIFYLVLCVAVSSKAAAPKNGQPQGSDVMARTPSAMKNLADMMICAINDCKPLAYHKYGCHCGTSGGLGEPVDEIDKCCQIHAQCYNKTGCNSAKPYKWECLNGEPKCGPEPAETCQKNLCECDRSFSECLKKQKCPSKQANCPSPTLHH